MRKMMLLFIGILLLVAGSKATSVPGNYVAEITTASTDHNPFVAVVTTQNKAIAYICDGDVLAEWFRADIQGGGLFETRSISKKSGITAQINAGSVVGVITLESGKLIQFRATPTEGAAGLYRSDDSINKQRFLGGWVVLPDGEQRGAVIGGGSTRPGRQLAFAAGKPLPMQLDPGLTLQPFQVTPEFLTKL